MNLNVFANNLPVEGDGGGYIEDPIDNHEQHNGKMKVQSLGFVLEKAFLFPYIWLDKDQLHVLFNEKISQYDGNSEN